MTARKSHSDHDIDTCWIDLNTRLIEADKRQNRRRAIVKLAGFAIAAILAMGLAGLIFWTAASRAAEAWA
jgi:hypothetical protein